MVRGDAALKDYSLKFDALDFDRVPMRVPAEDLDAALAAITPEVRQALELAAERIEKHHSRQLPKDDIYQDALGVTLGSRWTAIEAVGLYVPGGTASYPSSVLMNAVPAKVAGVDRIVIAVPATGGAVNPAVLWLGSVCYSLQIYYDFSGYSDMAIGLGRMFGFASPRTLITLTFQRP